ncbi:MAG: polysaccharide deacetylase family protein [Acidobacteriota bacterium]
MTESTPRLPGLIKGSIAWHLIGAAALAAAPSRWPWVTTALVANHALIALAGIMPRAQILGPCRSRLAPPKSAGGRIALTFDDGPDPEVTPAVLKLLEDRGVAATFFPIGQRAANHPSLVERITAAGHSLGNHSWSHSPAFFFHSLPRLAEEIDRSQEFLEAHGGKRPVHFRAPAGIRGPFLQPMLERRGMDLTAWNRRGFDTTDTQPYRILKRLTRRLGPGDILLLHDGSSARASDGRPVVLQVLPRLLDAIEARGLTPVALT